MFFNFPEMKITFFLTTTEMVKWGRCNSRETKTNAKIISIAICFHLMWKLRAYSHGEKRMRKLFLLSLSEYICTNQCSPSKVTSLSLDQLRTAVAPYQITVAYGGRHVCKCLFACTWLIQLRLIELEARGHAVLVIYLTMLCFDSRGLIINNTWTNTVRVFNRPLF